MLRWFKAFLPREERFFELFARHSQVVLQGALALQGMLLGGDETPVFCQRVNQFENDADNIPREVLTAVRRTFITPFTASTSRISSPRWTMPSTRCSKLPRRS